MRLSILCCVSASAMLIPASVHAAQTPDQILRDQQQQLDMQRQELLKRPDVFIPPPVVEPAAPEIKPPADAVCFEIKTIEFDGAPPEWQGWLHRQVASQEGQCLGLADVHALVQSLTNALVERGFVTSRIYLLEQNLKAGLLKFVVVPGRLGEIRLKQGGSDRSLRAAFPLRPGDILNVRDLEQGTEQLARARSQRATMEIVPGSQQGESDVVVTLERGKPWMATLSVDDSGQTSASGALSLRADGSLQHDGTTASGGALSLDAGKQAQLDGTLVAGGDLVAQADSVSGKGMLAAGSTADGTLSAPGALTLTASDALHYQGQILASDTLTLRGASLDLSGVRASSAHGDIHLDSGRTLVTDQASITAAGQLKLEAGGQFSNRDGALS
ncbi:MAG: POTRA domain-containing protein, partial [Microvirgula sp.]